jgi:predicted HTH domain antitoxin
LEITDLRKKWVIDLYFNQHKTYAEIAEIERISLRDIHAIIKEEIARRQKYKHSNSDKNNLLKPTNYFLKVRHLLKWPSH